MKGNTAYLNSESAVVFWHDLLFLSICLIMSTVDVVVLILLVLAALVGLYVVLQRWLHVCQGGTRFSFTSSQRGSRLERRPTDLSRATFASPAMAVMHLEAAARERKGKMC